MTFDPVTLSLSLTTLAAGSQLGGGLYELRVVDPAWRHRLDLVQPRNGGISRKRFWIPMHIVFELMLIASLVLAWTRPEVRIWLFVCLASHAAMRLWSAFDFIPKALAMERAEAGSVGQRQIEDWIRRSKLRLPLDWVSCGALVIALIQAGGAA